MPLDFLFNEPSIDHKATRQAVKGFFKQQYPRLKTLSNMDLQGVNYDSPKIQTSRTNNAEERTIRVIQPKHLNQCEGLTWLVNLLSKRDDLKNVTKRIKIPESEV